MPEISQIGPPPKPLQKKTSTFKIVLYLVILAILLIVLLYLLQQRKKSQGPTTTPSSLESTTTTTLPYRTLPLNQVPDVFPYDIPVPVEPPNLLLLSYFQIIGNKQQTTIQFISSKSAIETLSLYKNYLKDKRWTTLSAVEQETMKLLSAKKGTVSLSIMIKSGGSNKGALADLTIITFKKNSISPGAEK